VDISQHPTAALLFDVYTTHNLLEERVEDEDDIKKNLI
jgi:hypothetical protein